MAIAVQMDYTVDLCKPVHLIQMDVPFFTGDKNAHRFHVKLMRNGCAIDVSGMSATGYMVRADNQTVAWDGEVDGCDIYLTMPAACYAVAGRFRLLLRVAQDDTIETALWVEGSIREGTTEAIVDPGTTFPSLEELLAQIAKMEAVTAEGKETINDIKADATATSAQLRSDTAIAIEATNKATADAIAAKAELSAMIATAIVPTATGSFVSVSDAADRPVTQLVSHIEPMQSGSGEASPSNVRPFKAWNAVEINVTGANLLAGDALADKLVAVGAVKNTSAGTVSYYASSLEASPVFLEGIFKRTTQYTIMLYGRNTKNNHANMVVNYTNGAYDFIKFPQNKSDSVCVFHTNANLTIRAISGIYADGQTILYYDQCGVFEGAVSAEDFEHFGQTYTAALPETLYGLDIDWLSGKVYKRYHRIVFDGVTTGAKVDAVDEGMTTYAYIHYTTIPKAIKSGGKAYANKLHSVGTNTVISFSLPTELTGVTSTDSRDTLLAKYNAVLQSWYNAGTPLEIVYEVENPEEIQLAPQQINTLKGVTNAWSSAGETELSYIADTKMYIDQRISALLNN